MEKRAGIATEGVIDSDAGSSDVLDVVVAADLIAQRRAFLSLVARRYRPGNGSDVEALMRGERPTMRWWNDIHEALRGIPHAVGGGVAANQYRPPRSTADIDFVVRLRDLDKAEAAVQKAGWRKTGPLQLEGGLKGSSFLNKNKDELDLIGVPGALGQEAVNAAKRNYRGGLPYLTLRHLVVLKMIPNRTQDLADITTMLGHASKVQIAGVRRAVKKHLRADDLADLEQMIAMGQLERGR